MLYNKNHNSSLSTFSFTLVVICQFDWTIRKRQNFENSIKLLKKAVKTWARQRYLCLWVQIFWRNHILRNESDTKRQCLEGTRLKRLILGSRKKIINLDYRLDRLDKVIYAKYSKQFKWNSYFYVSGQNWPFGAALKLL